jgi:hypothetical protein
MDEKRQDDPVNARAEESPSLPADHQPIEVDGSPTDMRTDNSEKDNPELPSLPKAEPKSLTAHKRTTVKVEYKHSLATRWMHWINFPLLFVMIYSGILIYWADSQHEGLNSHRVYRVGVGNWTLFRFFPHGSTTGCISNTSSHKAWHTTSSSCGFLLSMESPMSSTLSCRESGAA